MRERRPRCVVCDEPCEKGQRKYCLSCVCGRLAGAKRHYKRGERPCRPCLDAAAKSRTSSGRRLRAGEPCAECGGPLPRGRWVVCSERCRIDRLVNSDAYRRAQLARGKRGRWLDDRVWVAGYCARCTQPFVLDRDDPQIRFCSKQCKKNRPRPSVCEPYVRGDIFKRDGWRCHICNRKCRRDVGAQHSLSPTIDHIQPLAAGGADTRRNVATAHRICNSRKSHTGAGQLRLIA